MRVSRRRGVREPCTASSMSLGHRQPRSLRRTRRPAPDCTHAFPSAARHESDASGWFHSNVDWRDPGSSPLPGGITENGGCLVTARNRASRGMLMLSCLAIGLIVMGLAARTASAQVLYGSIAGTLTDETGATVPGATISVTNTSTGLSRQATTDQSGHYSIPNLLEGTYDVSVEASGFKPYTQKGVVVRINAATEVNSVVQLGALNEQVTVEATNQVLQTTKTDVNVSLDTESMENLPLSGYRNFQSLINLVPGTTPAQFQNAVTDTPGRALTTNVNGQERGANNTRLDGSADILVTMPHHAVYVAPVESIEEVNISTNNFDAEQGMTGGAAVTVITKSGTNELRGGVFGSYTNDAFRAFTWDENFGGVTDKPKESQHGDGANLGGPIIKNKLFFFANWEGTFQRVNRSNLYSVPTADFRTGDFSRTLGANILDGSGNIIPIRTTEGGTVPLQEGMVFDPFSG